MDDINYLAVVAAAVAAFIGSSIWYAVFGKEMAKVSKAFAELQKEKPAAWRILAVFTGSLVLAFVLAYVINLKADVTVGGALELGFLLWLGLSAVQWLSSMVWEKVPLKMAAIHGGDWLMKILVITGIVGAWR